MLASLYGESLYGLHIDLNLDGLTAAAQRNALNGRDVSIIASPRERDVAFRRHHIIGGIEVDPAGSREKDRHPGVRRLRTLDIASAPHISADIARRQPLRSQRTDHDMRKVLTHASPVAEDLDQRNINGC